MSDAICCNQLCRAVSGRVVEFTRLRGAHAYPLRIRRRRWRSVVSANRSGRAPFSQNDRLGRGIRQFSAHPTAVRIVTVNYPALEVCDVFGFGLAIGVETPNVERVDVGGISAPPMRRIAVGTGVGAVEIDASRNRAAAGMGVGGIFESDQWLQEHRRFRRWIVGERRHRQFVRCVMLRDGAEMIQKLPIVKVPVGAAREWQVGFVANRKSKYRGMIAISLRQPLSSALDIHSLVVYQSGIRIGSRKGEPRIDRDADDDVNRVDAMIPAQVQELIAAVVRRPCRETGGRGRRAEAHSRSHTPIERAPLRA